MQPLMQPKVFSVEEASALLPGIGELLDRAYNISEIGNNLRQHLKELVNIWGQSIFDTENPDNNYYHSRVVERDLLAKQLQSIISQITSTGAIVRDVGKGLVDFQCVYNDRLIFLCWKRGEPKICHWHAPDSCYEGRRSVDELRQTTLNA